MQHLNTDVADTRQGEGLRMTLWAAEVDPTGAGAGPPEKHWHSPPPAAPLPPGFRPSGLAAPPEHGELPPSPVRADAAAALQEVPLDDPPAAAPAASGA